MTLTEATEYTCPTCHTHKFKSIEVDCEEAYYPATQCSSGHWHRHDCNDGWVTLICENDHKSQQSVCHTCNVAGCGWNSISGVSSCHFAPDAKTDLFGDDE